MSSNSKIDAAIARTTKTQPVALVEATIRITQKAIKVTKSGEFAFTRGPNADPLGAHLLVYDATSNAYTPVLTPPGTSWELVAKQQGPGIWTPGKPT